MSRAASAEQSENRPPHQRCRIVLGSLGQSLLAPNQHTFRQLLAEHFKPTDRVRILLESLPSGELVSVLEAETPEDLHDAYARIQNEGNAAVRDARRAELSLGDARLLYEIVRGAQREFQFDWVTAPVEEKRGAISDSLRRYHDQLHVVATAVDATTPKIKIPDPKGFDFLDSAKVVNRSWLDVWRKWFVPTSDRAAKIAEVRQVYLTEEVFSRHLLGIMEPLSMWQAKQTGGAVPSAEQLELWKLTSDERENGEQLKERNRALLLRGLERMGDSAEAKSRANTLYKKIKSVDTQAVLDAYLLSAASKLKKMDALLNELRAHVGRKPRDFEDMSSNETKLRFTVALRSYVRARRSSLDMLRQPTEFAFAIDYKTDKPLSVLRSPTYQQVLNDEYDTAPPKGSLVAVRDLDKLKADSEIVRRSEKPIWLGLDKVEGEIFEIMRHHGKISSGTYELDEKAVEQKMKLAREELVRIRIATDTYLQELHEKIRLTDKNGLLIFSAGAKRLVTRTAVLGELVDYYDVLRLRGESRLDLSSAVPDMETETKSITSMLRRHFAVRGILGAGALAVGGAGLYAWLYFF